MPRLLDEAIEELRKRPPATQDAIAAIILEELREPSRVRFPIFESTSPGSLALTNAEVARLEAEEDESRHL